MNKKFALDSARKLIINNVGMQIAIWVPFAIDEKIRPDEIDWLDDINYHKTDKIISFSNSGRIFILSSENWTRSRGMSVHYTFICYSYPNIITDETIQAAFLSTRLGDDPHVRLI